MPDLGTPDLLGRAFELWGEIWAREVTTVQMNPREGAILRRSPKLGRSQSPSCTGVELHLPTTQLPGVTLGTLPLRPLPMSWAVQGTNAQFNCPWGQEEFTKTPVASQKLSELRAANFFLFSKSQEGACREGADFGRGAHKAGSSSPLSVDRVPHPSNLYTGSSQGPRPPGPGSHCTGQPQLGQGGKLEQKRDSKQVCSTQSTQFQHSASSSSPWAWRGCPWPPAGPRRSGPSSASWYTLCFLGR